MGTLYRVDGVIDGPDETLYVLTDGNEVKILRVAPKKPQQPFRVCRRP